jgi:hypothetical protein
VDPDGRDIQKAIDALVKSNKLSTNTTSVISKAMIENLYKAESKRMSVLEKLGLDGTTIGRGQVGELAYTDVLSKFENEITSYAKDLGIDITKNFYLDIKNEDIEDFIVTAYLSICINNRQKEGRSKEDAAKFGIGYYHGASVSIRKAQATNQDTLSFNGTEQALKNGNKEEKDILNYINEVMYGEK